MSNLKIYFIRHSKLDLIYKDHMEMPYEILGQLGSGKLDPSIAKNSKKLFNESNKNLPLSEIDFIYFNNSSSQSQRSMESASLIKNIIKEKYKKNVPVLGNPDLKEIDFNIKKLLSKNNFEKTKMSGLRTALYKAILNKGPVENIDELFKRIEKIIKNLENHKKENQTVLLVSHDFFMRIIELYINKSKDYKKITLDDIENTSLNTYFKGFATSYDLKLFKRY